MYIRLTSDGELVLPTLYHPPLPNAPPSTAWFKITNDSDQPLTLNIEGILNHAMANAMTLSVLDRASNAPISSIPIGPKQNMEIKVKIEAREKTRLPRFISSKYQDRHTLGRLHLSSDRLSESILLQGSIKPVFIHLI